MARLRQCCAGGLTSLPVQPSAVSAQRCCAIHRRSLRRSDHITDALASFHWLKVPERIQLATIVYRSLNGTAPRYLAVNLRRLSDMPSRRRLRSSLTDQLDVRQSQCSTVGDRSFTVAGARLWNSLPHDIVVNDTLSHFRCGLKTFLFDSHILLFCFSSLLVVLAVFT